MIDKSQFRLFTNARPVCQSTAIADLVYTTIRSAWQPCRDSGLYLYIRGVPQLTFHQQCPWGSAPADQHEQVHQVQAPTKWANIYG